MDSLSRSVTLMLERDRISDRIRPDGPAPTIMTWGFVDLVFGIEGGVD